VARAGAEMKRNDKNPAWKNFLQEIRVSGQEVVTRLGNPLMVHKRDMPFSKDTVTMVFFAHKSRRAKPRDQDDGFSKNQLKGIKIYTDLGFKVTRLRMG
jgi:hypothetical protein